MTNWRMGASVLLFFAVGGMALAYLFFRLGEAEWQGDWGYTIYAEFPTTGALGPGSPVEVAGVQVGRVEQIELTGYRARVKLKVRQDLELQEDAIASIRTRGLIGEDYLSVSLGASDRLIPPGGKIRDIEAPIDLPELIAAYVRARKRADSAPKD